MVKKIQIEEKKDDPFFNQNLMDIMKQIVSCFIFIYFNYI